MLFKKLAFQLHFHGDYTVTWNRCRSPGLWRRYSWPAGRCVSLCWSHSLEFWVAGCSEQLSILYPLHMHTETRIGLEQCSANLFSLIITHTQDGSRSNEVLSLTETPGFNNYFCAVIAWASHSDMSLFIHNFSQRVCVCVCCRSPLCAYVQEKMKLLTFPTCVWMCYSAWLRAEPAECSDISLKVLPLLCLCALLFQTIYLFPTVWPRVYAQVFTCVCVCPCHLDQQSSRRFASQLFFMCVFKCVCACAPVAAALSVKCQKLWLCCHGNPR